MGEWVLRVEIFYNDATSEIFECRQIDLVNGVLHLRKDYMVYDHVEKKHVASVPLTSIRKYVILE